MSESIRFLWANKLHHMRERVLLHNLITRCRHRGLLLSLRVTRFETPQCINSCRMIWWSTYGGFEATPTSFHLICLKTCQIICLFCWTVTFICKNKPNIGKIYQIRQTVNLFVKLRQKRQSPGVYLGRRLEVRRSPRWSFVQSGAIYRRIWPWGTPTAGDALMHGVGPP
jgi:hypothetical protein